MSIDYSQLALPKGRPAKLAKADKTKDRESRDDAESRKVKARSGGQCEIVLSQPTQHRCPRRGLHVHHLLGGFGVRGRGDSALAANKLHVCERCHSDIHAKVLIRLGDAWKLLK
jgi:hypothetical protein